MAEHNPHPPWIRLHALLFLLLPYLGLQVVEGVQLLEEECRTGSDSNARPQVGTLSFEVPCVFMCGLGSGHGWDLHAGEAECGTSTGPRPLLPPALDTPGAMPRPLPRLTCLHCRPLLGLVLA